MHNSRVTKGAIYTFLLATILLPTFLLAGEHSASSTGVSGYDLVSYHTGKKPLVGNGNHVVEHQGVTYLFISEENKRAFAANPKKYLPAYGGWCAYGVALGKKFVADPTVWKIVDGKLYLNLDTSIQTKWQEDISGKISMASNQWNRIKDLSPSQL